MCGTASRRFCNRTRVAAGKEFHRRVAESTEKFSKRLRDLRFSAVQKISNFVLLNDTISPYPRRDCIYEYGHHIGRPTQQNLSGARTRRRLRRGRAQLLQTQVQGCEGRGEGQLSHRAGRGGRLSRPERRGQDHYAQDALGPAASHQRTGQRAGSASPTICVR